jgi:hypothetical protein
MRFKIWFENTTEPIIAYHQTSLENAKKIKRYGFSTKKSTFGIIWFTTDLEELRNNNIGAQGSGAILKIAVDIRKPAGWKEYDQLLLVQLAREYDGAILPHPNGTFNGFVFDPKKVKVLEILDITRL